MTPIRIVIVDDHRVVSESLKSYLDAFPEFHVVATAASGEVLLRSVRDWAPLVVIQDLLLPGGMDGIETIRRLQREAPRVRVIALTASTDEARMVGAMRAGASGYVRKDADPEVLLAAIRAVAAGRTYLDPSVAPQVLALAEAPGDLTERELQVLRQLTLGQSNKEIAAVLSVTEETVKTHVAHVLMKLQVDNRSQAVTQALKLGLVSLDD
jgi:DNA-binding NarL/FixJ family response regulator